jgi:hypothetical protein
MSTPEIKYYLGAKSGITILTGQWCLHKMNWQYDKATKGIYIDGHEQIDVVEYVRGHLSVSLPSPFLLSPCSYVLDLLTFVPSLGITPKANNFHTDGPRTSTPMA